MMLRAFFAISLASPCWDDERVVRLLDELPEIGRTAAPRTGDGFDDASLVDAEAALHPVDLAAPARRFLHHPLNPVLGVRMVLLGDVAAMHGVGVWRLLGEGDAHRALVREHVDV